MSPKQSSESRSRRDPVPRLLSSAAFLLALLALVFSMGGLAFSRDAHSPAALRHVKKKSNANLRSALAARCPVSSAIDLGTWCLEGTTFRVPPADVGKNDYLYATQKCVREGGWLPSAAQL